MKILVASSAPWVSDQITGGLSSSEIEVKSVADGTVVRQELVDYKPDILIADMQIGNMGGIAVAIDARMEAEERRCKDVAIVLLLDREADRFLAERANVDATVIKPIDILTLRKLIRDLEDNIVLRQEVIDSNDPDIFDEEGLPIHIN